MVWTESQTGMRFIKVDFPQDDKVLWVSETEVTQKQWTIIMGSEELHPEKPSPFFGKNEELPKVSISYLDVQAFIGILKSKSKLDFRLPTAQEFRYLCETGKTQTIIAHYKGSLNEKVEGPLVVASLEPDIHGLYDIQGNVYEWTSTAYFETHARQTRDSLYSTNAKTLKGGSWAFGYSHLECSHEIPHNPGHWGYSIGFRLVFQE